MSFKLLVWSLSNLFLRIKSCVTTSCSCCMFPAQPVTSLLCFFAVISLIQWSICTLRVQHELPRVVVSASFASCRNVKNGPLLRSRRRQYMCSHPISLDKADRSRIWPIWFCDLFICLPECVVGCVIGPLPFSWSVSSSMRRILLNHIIRDSQQNIISIFVQLSISF